MNRLSTEKRAAVVAALVEGNSIRATARMTDVSKPTILKLLADRCGVREVSGRNDPQRAHAPRAGR